MGHHGQIKNWASELGIKRPFDTYARTHVLETEVKNTLDDYDVVLIDCPPNMGGSTRGRLRIATATSPTISDYLSTYGIDQIVKRVNEFGRAINESIEPYGIITTSTARRRSCASTRSGVWRAKPRTATAPPAGLQGRGSGGQSDRLVGRVREAGHAPPEVRLPGRLRDRPGPGDRDRHRGGGSR
jgi:hypothetical protein